MSESSSVEYCVGSFLVLETVFFLLAKFRQKANFLNLWPIFGEIWTQKNFLVTKISSILTHFHPLSGLSSNIWMNWLQDMF
jgi:hypothetical protein